MTPFETLAYELYKLTEIEAMVAEEAAEAHQ